MDTMTLYVRDGQSLLEEHVDCISQMTIWFHTVSQPVKPTKTDKNRQNIQT